MGYTHDCYGYSLFPKTKDRAFEPECARRTVESLEIFSAYCSQYLCLTRPKFAIPHFPSLERALVHRLGILQRMYNTLCSHPVCDCDEDVAGLLQVCVEQQETN